MLGVAGCEKSDSNLDDSGQSKAPSQEMPGGQESVGPAVQAMADRARDLARRMDDRANSVGRTRDIIHESTDEIAVKEVAKEAIQDELPKPDANTPLEKYTEIDGADNLSALYYSLASIPPDYESLAGIFSKEYRSTRDAFRKREILAGVKSVIDSRIQKFRTNRYFFISNRVSVQHYDFDKKSFPVKGVNSDGYIYWNSGGDGYKFKMSYDNGSRFADFPVTDEGRAREIESLVTKYKADGHAKIYLFAKDVNLDEMEVKANVVMVRLYDENNQVIGEY